MGFKAKARKHKAGSSSKEKKEKPKEVEGVMRCGIKDCDNWADKNMGGRSLSLDDVKDIWGDDSYAERKGRVRVCKKCYRHYKKEAKDDMEY